MLDLDKFVPQSGSFRRSHGTVSQAPTVFVIGPGARDHRLNRSVKLNTAMRLNFDHLLDPTSTAIEDVLIERIDRDPRPRPKGNRPCWVARQLGEFMHQDGDVVGLSQVIDEARRRGLLEQFDLDWWLTAWRAA